MTNARDKANIPVLNFQSKGIDDNATSTAVTITSGADVQIGSTNSGVGGAIDLSIGNLSSSGGITLWSPTNGTHSIGFGDGFSGTDRYRGYLEYAHTGDSMRFATSSTERMRLNSTGLGIGTTSPDAVLQVGALGQSGADRGAVAIKTVANYTTFGQAGIYIEEASGSEGYYMGVDVSGGMFFNNSGLAGTTLYLGDDDNVGIGTSSPEQALHIQSDSGIRAERFANNAGSANLDLRKSRNATVGSHTILQNGDSVGGIIFRGSDGTAFEKSSAIFAQVDGTPGTDDMPGRLTFWTTPDGTNNYLERMRITSAGSVGIGTTSPSQPLDVVGSAQISFSSGVNTYQYFQSTSNFIGRKTDGNLNIGVAGSQSIVSSVGGSEKMRISSNGDVGIGISSPAHRLSVFDGSTGIVARFATTGNRSLDISSADNGIYAGAHWNRDVNSAGGIQSFSTEGNENMRISSTGIVLNESSQDLDFRVESNGISNMFVVDGASDKIFINTSSSISGSSAYIHLKNNYTRTGMSLESNNTAAHHSITFHNPNGQVGSINTSGSSTVYNTSSDYRLKENVSYDFDATTRIKQLKPARFNFIADADTTVDGFIAHEVSSVVPEAISGEKDAVDDDGNPKYQGIDQSKLVPLLVKTIQELEARITTLEANNP